LPLVGILSTGTALMLTHSRAGFTSGMIGVFVALLGLRFAKILPTRFGNGLIAGAVLLAVGGFAISGAGLEERFGYLDSSQRVRMHLYEQVLTAASQAPATGYGYGTFEPGFRPFKDLRLSGSTWSLAHNSYLEFYFGTGLYGVIILVGVFFCVFFALAKRVFLHAKDISYLIIGVSSMMIVGLHSLTDFSIQMPAVGILFLYSIGLSSGHNLINQKRRRSLNEEQHKIT
jgi:O-antigen ligase